ncbi:ABC transporter ATP-binding protein [bacterium]|nr:MAG: ABC transporter ATP-binding protein [bacterium]
MEAKKALTVTGLRLSRGGAPVLDIPSLEVFEGETLALVGPNGAGKSTLLLCLAGLQKPDGGEIRHHSHIVSATPASLEYRRRIAVVFQEPLLLRDTVYGNVATGPRLRNLPKAETDRRVMENLERFSITHLRDRRARTLSGGEAQRTSLARAFAVNPEIIFLDEPFSALDPPTREALLRDLGKSLKETRTTALFATHDRVEALQLGDRMLVMRGGRVAQLGSPDEVLNRPADEFVASFVGMETLLRGTVIEAGGGYFTLDVKGREIDVVGDAAVGEAALIGIRPENVTLHVSAEKAQSSARNRLEGKILKIIPQGPLAKVEVDCGFTLTALVTSRSLEELAVREGAQAGVSFKTAGIHVLKRGV